MNYSGAVRPADGLGGGGGGEVTGVGRGREESNTVDSITPGPRPSQPNVTKDNSDDDSEGVGNILR